MVLFLLSVHRGRFAVARRRDRATGWRARCLTTRSRPQRAGAWRRLASLMPPPGARSSRSTGRPGAARTGSPCFLERGLSTLFRREKVSSLTLSLADPDGFLAAVAQP